MIESGATLTPMDEENTPTDEELHVIPLPMPKVNQHELPQPSEATFEDAAGSRVVHGQNIKCEAHSSRTGERCKLWAVLGSNVCHVHGAAAGTPARAAADQRVLDSYRAQLHDMAAMALGRITEILEDPEDDKVGLAAAKDVLDRAGLGAVQKTANLNVELQGGVDIDAEIEELMVKGKGPAIDVTGTDG